MEDDKTLKYTREDGVFKNICNKVFEDAYKKFKIYINSNELKLRTSRDEKEFIVKNQKNLTD